jgi:hypothetical protein
MKILSFIEDDATIQNPEEISGLSANVSQSFFVGTCQPEGASLFSL